MKMFATLRQSQGSGIDKRTIHCGEKQGNSDTENIVLGEPIKGDSDAVMVRSTDTKESRRILYFIVRIGPGNAGHHHLDADYPNGSSAELSHQIWDPANPVETIRCSTDAQEL